MLSRRDPKKYLHDKLVISRENIMNVFYRCTGIYIDSQNLARRSIEDITVTLKKTYNQRP